MSTESISAGSMSAGSQELPNEFLTFLSRLPMLLNSNLALRPVVDVALRNLAAQLKCEAATVFLLNPGGKELTFWALKGGSSTLESQVIPSDKGIVGWVIQNRSSAIVDDAQNDPRLLRQIGSVSGFITRNMICCPLIVRGKELLGAVQILNKQTDATGSSSFDSVELKFLEQVSIYLALAIHNAQLYESLSAKNHQLEVLDRRKNEMMMVITHEFMTPLSLIRNTADMLASGMVKADQAGRVGEMLFNAVDRLTRTVSQVKNLTVLQQGNIRIERAAVSTLDFIEPLKAQLEYGAKHRTLQVSFSVSDPAPVVDADFSLLLIVLRNIFANAIRFTPDGGSIDVTIQQEIAGVSFSVRDSGIGIEPQEQHLIFEKFYEVTDVLHHSSGSYEFKSCGLGLGLSTVKTILDAHGINIRLTSAVGKGATFSFVLPCAPPASTE